MSEFDKVLRRIAVVEEKGNVLALEWRDLHIRLKELEWPSEARIDTIGSNGNDGDHYK